MTTTTIIFILLMVFQIKHLIADYYLQTPRMYLNKGKSYGWFWPLVEHAGVHAIGTFVIIIITLVLTGGFAITDIQLIALVASGFDFLTHFAIDRWKATKKQTPDQPAFWVSLGWDQMGHHIVGILIIISIISIIGI